MKITLDPEDIETLCNSVAERIVNRLGEVPSSLLTVEELAALLKVPKGWVYDRTRNKGGDGIPCVKVGKYVRFSLPQVMEWLKDQDFR